MNDIFALIRELQIGLAAAHANIAELHAKQERLFRYGRVTDVDAKKHRYRQVVDIDEDGNEVKSAWIPYGQIAGRRKVHSAPSVGQQMLMIAPDGDHAMAFGLPMTWHDGNPSPSQDGDEDVDLRGKTKRTQRDGSLKEEVDGVTRTVSKQSHSLTIHKDEANAKKVDDANPWEGNKASPLHGWKITKDGGLETNINIGGNEHKIVAHPQSGIEVSFGNGKHKMRISASGVSHSVDDGQHEMKIMSASVGGLLSGQLGSLLGAANLGALANLLRGLVQNGGISALIASGPGGVGALLNGQIGSILGPALTSQLASELAALQSAGNLLSAVTGGIMHKSNMRVQIEASQIEHLGDLKVAGAARIVGVLQSVTGVKAPLYAPGAAGDPGDAKDW